MNRTATGAVFAGAAAAAWGAAALADRRRIEHDPARAALDAPLRGIAQKVAGARGTQLHVETFGPPDAPAIVLSHGWTCARRFWALQIQALSGERRVIAYDQRGHGDSAAPPHGDWSMEALGEDLERVLDATLQPGERAVIAGHSLGGMSIAAWARLRGGAAGRAHAVAFLNTGMGGQRRGRARAAVGVAADAGALDTGRAPHDARDRVRSDRKPRDGRVR